MLNGRNLACYLKFLTNTTRPRSAFSWRLGSPVLLHFSVEERHASLQLIHAIHSIFYTDPTVKAHSFQFDKDGIIVIYALSNFPMCEALGIAYCPTCLFT